MNDVTVCIPTIPERGDLLLRAVASAQTQTYPVAAISIACAGPEEGASSTRNRAAQLAETKWIAFLDDDDELRPEHVATLLEVAERERAVMVVPWFTVKGGSDPFPGKRGKTWDPDQPHVFPITYLIRTDVFRLGPGFQDDSPPGDWMIQDLPVARHAATEGPIVMIPDQTWIWHHHGMNTNGIPKRR